MKYREMKKHGIECSTFGLGCMRFPMKDDGKGGRIVDEEIAIDIIRRAIDGGVNYVDTAYVYSEKQNEGVVGRALRDGYREKVYLATKLPAFLCESAEDFDKFLEEQLAALQTDYIDFYLVHALNREKWDKVREFGIRDFLDRKKKEGKIKYACFSFHDNYDAFEYILNDYDWDMCQIQFNYMDINNQAGLKGLKLAGEKGIPVVIMEGLLGGKLAKAPANVQDLYDAFPVKRTAVEWAFRWLCNFPEVSVILSGVTDTEQLYDNIRIFSDADANSMSDDELDLMDKVREAYLSRIKVGCTACKYCMPCPNGVNIPGIFGLWNDLCRYEKPFLNNPGYKKYIQNEKDASRCVECGACEAVCPQSIEIIEMLKVAHKDFCG